MGIWQAGGYWLFFFLGLLFSETVKNRWLVQQNQGEPVFQNKKIKKEKKKGRKLL